MKRIFIHIGFIFLSILLITFIILRVLRSYTKHNETLIEVPVLEGLNSKKAIDLLESMNLDYSVMDTVYKDGAKKLSVINQNPLAGQKVKSGRTIYLVINSDEIPMVEVPELAGKTSLNQATGILSRLGLKLGEVIEEPSNMVKSRANQPVLGQRQHGTDIDLQPGSLIERNSLIDLVIGVPIGASDSTDINETNGEEELIELF